jgi:O-antigen ligase
MASGFVMLWSFVHHRGLNFFLRVLGFAYLPVYLFLVLETQSRAAFLATLVAFGAFFLRGSLVGKMKLLIAIAIFGGLAFSVANTGTIDRLKDAAALGSSSSSEGPDGSTQSRVQLLKDSIRLTFENPLLGVGPGMFMVAQNTMARSEGAVNGSWHGTHNTYTQFSSEVGLPAMLLFLTVIYYCVSSILATDRLNGTTPSIQRDRNRAALMSLQGMWVLYIVAFCFFHLAFEAFLPTLIALTMATTGAITRDCLAIQAAQTEAAG